MSEKKSVVITSAVRTAIGSLGGTLKNIPAYKLGSSVISSAIKKSNLKPSEIDEVIMGHVLTGGAGQNPARQAAIESKLPKEIPSYVVNQVCGSGLRSIASGYHSILSGNSSIVIAGGVESMRRAPFVIPKSSSAFSRNAEIYDTTIGWRFVNPKMKQEYGIDSMPETAENVAVEFQINRKDQDSFAFRSQQRAKNAQSNENI